jgi:hypothetical protein
LGYPVVNCFPAVGDFLFTGKFPGKGDMQHSQQKSTELNQSQLGRVKYVPPDAKTLKDYAFAVCADLARIHHRYNDDQIRQEFTSFLNFVAQKTAHYLTKGHKTYLLKDYHPNPFLRKAGTTNAKEKHNC